METFLGLRVLLSDSDNEDRICLTGNGRTVYAPIVSLALADGLIDSTANARNMFVSQYGVDAECLIVNSSVWEEFRRSMADSIVASGIVQPMGTESGEPDNSEHQPFGVKITLETTINDITVMTGVFAGRTFKKIEIVDPEIPRTTRLRRMRVRLFKEIQALLVKEFEWHKENYPDLNYEGDQANQL